MGRVYLARDRWLGRMVALKQAHDDALARRLAREVRVTAGLEHPGIITVYDEGRDDDGQLFYTMRLMRGRPLSQLLAEQPAGERLALLGHYLDACQALAYAHAQGVVHRDLKPANIMVGAFGETQVVDWGLAHRPGAADPDTASDTRPGAIVGTPAYMSPEQARGEPADRRSDVWGLGAVLHELLLGAPPRRATTTPRIELPRDLPSELAAIVHRALADDPAARYPDAAALADDVAAYLEGRRVQAHHYTLLALALRLVRQWRGPLLVAAAALLVIATLLVLGNLSLRAQRDRAVAAETHLRAAKGTADRNLATALVAQARAAGRPTRLASAALPDCRPLVALTVDDLLCGEDLSLRRVTAGVERWRVPTTKLTRELRVEGDRVWAVSSGFTLTTLSLATGQPDDEAWEIIDFNVGDAWPVRTAAWLPGLAQPQILGSCGAASVVGVSGLLDGRYAVLCSDGALGRGDDPDLPDLVHALDPRDFVSFTHMVLTPDARGVVVVGAHGRVAMHDLDTRQTFTLAADRPNPVRQLVMAPTGDRVALARERGGVEVHALPELRHLGTIAAANVRDIRLFADGSVLVADATTATQWALPAAPRPRLLTHPHGLASLALAPDGDTLLTTHGEGRTVVWDLPSGLPRHDLEVGGGTVKAGTFLTDGQRFAVVDASAGSPGPRVFSAATGAPVWTPPTDLRTFWHSGRGRQLAPGHELPLMGRRVVALTGDILVFSIYAAGLLAVDIDTGADVPTTGCPNVEWPDIAAAPDHTRAVLVGVDSSVHELLPGPPLQCRPLAVPAGATSADISSDGRIVVVGGSRFLARTGPDGLRWSVAHPGRWPNDVALSPDHRWIASAGPDDVARVWDADTGALRAVLTGHHARVSAVDFSRDGATLATASWDGTARLWDVATLDAPTAVLVHDATRTWGLALADALDRSR